MTTTKTNALSSKAKVTRTWLDKLQRLKCSRHDAKRMMMMCFNYNHLSESEYMYARSLDQTSGGTVYHRNNDHEFSIEESSFDTTICTSLDSLSQHGNRIPLREERTQKRKKTVTFGSIQVFVHVSAERSRQESDAHAQNHDPLEEYSSETIIREEEYLPNTTTNVIVPHDIESLNENDEEASPSMTSATMTRVLVEDNRHYKQHESTQLALSNYRVLPASSQIGMEADEEVLREAFEQICQVKQCLRTMVVTTGEDPKKDNNVVSSTIDKSPPTASHDVSPPLSEIGYEADVEALREALELISGAKLMLRQFEKEECKASNSNVRVETREDDDDEALKISRNAVSTEMKSNFFGLCEQNEPRDSITSEDSKTSSNPLPPVMIETRQVEEAAFGISRNPIQTGAHAQSPVERNDRISLHKLYARISNVNEIVRNFVVTQSPWKAHEGAIEANNGYSSAPQIQHESFAVKDDVGINRKDATQRYPASESISSIQQPLPQSGSVLKQTLFPDESPGLQVHRVTVMKERSTTSSRSAEFVVVNSESAREPETIPGPNSNHTDPATGARLNQSRKVTFSTQEQERDKLDHPRKSPLGFFWRSHPNTPFRRVYAASSPRIIATEQ